MGKSLINHPTKDIISAGTHFHGVTLLITHYNRALSLKRLLEAFRNFGSTFEEVIVSDDGSSAEQLESLEQLREEFDFTLLKAIRNSGLGNNINKGQDAVKTPYTLYVQEDFVPIEGFEKPLLDGMAILEEMPAADYVRFYSYHKHPNLKPYKNGFSEMVFDVLTLNTNKFHIYSDHPHLRRGNFLEKFGRYNETKHSDKIEFDMLISFLKNKGKGFIYENYNTVFDQVNTAVEPSTVKREFWRTSNFLPITMLRYFYRQYIFNYSYFLKKQS